MNGKMNVRHAPLGMSHLLWVVSLVACGLWSALASASASYMVPVTALVAVVGLRWQHGSSRARRWHAALDAYADREMARGRAFRMGAIAARRPP